MPLTLDQFRAAVRRDKDMLRVGTAPTGVMTCCNCGVPLQESVTGNRKLANGPGCSDCYYEEFGAELDSHPIGVLRVARGG